VEELSNLTYTARQQR